MLMSAIDCLNFTVQVYYSSGDALLSKSPDIRNHENLYTLEHLKPYTVYKVYVTVTNEAKLDPESIPSNMITVRTLASHAMSKLLFN